MSHTFTAGFLFCGLGAGALGFLQAMGQMPQEPSVARFRSLGGIDNDPKACADFTYLTKSPALCADLSKLSVAQLQAAWGDKAPDAIFLSPPCKGMSGLLSKAASLSPKYQALNRLVLQGLFLACETWAIPPALLVLENVPRIQTRGKELLDQSKQLLSAYGYVFHEATHDCGEIGGLAQHRRRYLLVARHVPQVPCYVYRPPTQRVRGCGEVLGTLPLPCDPSAGELHRLPKLSWLNWLRLALIPAGGDWRDLPGQSEVSLKKTAEKAATFAGRPGLFGVNDWGKPMPTVTGSATVSSSNSVAAVADPRQLGWFRGVLGVQNWNKPSPTITGRSGVTTGAYSVADPRLTSPLQPGQKRSAVWSKYKVRHWKEPAETIAGPGTNGEYGVADPRLSLPDSANRHENKYRVTDWAEPAATVTGARPVTSGGPSVADPRLGCTPRSGAYGVMSWEEAAATVTGSASIDNSAVAVADPRKAPSFIPVIIAADNTWHRPLTTLELAALQGLPATVDGQPLQLAGKSSSGWRERIGNAVPVGAAQAIGASLLTALLAARLGTWTLGGTGIWVRKQDLREASSSGAEAL